MIGRQRTANQNEVTKLQTHKSKGKTQTTGSTNLPNKSKHRQSLLFLSSLEGGALSAYSSLSSADIQHTHSTQPQQECARTYNIEKEKTAIQTFNLKQALCPTIFKAGLLSSGQRYLQDFKQLPLQPDMPSCTQVNLFVTCFLIW